MSDFETRATEADARRIWKRSASPVSARVITIISFVLIALIGGVAGMFVFFRTASDPLETLFGAWPVVVIAAAIYAIGMCVYAASWASLFDSTENRRLVALAFLLSQPVKYLPGGIAQPVGQVALTAQASDSGRRALVAFPVHVVVNVIAALTLSSPLLFLIDIPGWSRWIIVVVPLLWSALDRRWMTSVLGALGRIHRVFLVSADLPKQNRINSAFGFALLAHALMFAAFGTLARASVSGWSFLGLSFAYGIAWVVGYVALPIPAGLGAREAVLAIILTDSMSTLDVLKVSGIHRVTTLSVELLLLMIALLMARSELRKPTGEM